jgi:hypothetical protein
METERRKRLLTDADIEALAEALEDRMLQRFHLNLGKGVLGMIWKGVIIVLLVLAAYGAGIKGIKF